MVEKLGYDHFKLPAIQFFCLLKYVRMHSFVHNNLFVDVVTSVPTRNQRYSM